MRNQDGTYTLRTNSTMVRKLSDGSVAETYNLNILLAVVNQRDMFRGPGSCLARLGGYMSELMARAISLRYLWSLLKLDISTDGKVQLTASNTTTGSSSQAFKDYPMLPVLEEGPEVGPPRDSNNWRRGSLLKCS